MPLWPTEAPRRRWKRLWSHTHLVPYKTCSSVESIAHSGRLSREGSLQQRLSQSHAPLTSRCVPGFVGIGIANDRQCTAPVLHAARSPEILVMKPTELLMAIAHGKAKQDKCGL